MKGLLNALVFLSRFARYCAPIVFSNRLRPRIRSAAVSELESIFASLLFQFPGLEILRLILKAASDQCRQISNFVGDASFMPPGGAIRCKFALVSAGNPVHQTREFSFWYTGRGGEIRRFMQAANLGRIKVGRCSSRNATKM